MTISLTHVALHVEDIDACIEFYKEFCNMKVTHRRTGKDPAFDVAWMSEPGKEQDFIFVVVGYGKAAIQDSNDIKHLGFAVESKAEVDRLAELAKKKGCLFWAARDEGYPIGYYCAVTDPNGTVVEFSYGQPLGPGSPDYKIES